MGTLNGIIAKSAEEKERLIELEKKGLAKSIQDPPREGVRILMPVRYHLTELGRATLDSLKSQH